jgi:hypothetical protein
MFVALAAWRGTDGGVEQDNKCSGASKVRVRRKGGLGAYNQRQERTAGRREGAEDAGRNDSTVVACACSRALEPCNLDGENCYELTTR